MIDVGYVVFQDVSDRSPPWDRYAMGNCFLLVAFLTLLALADNILANALPLALESEPPQVPGFWNLTTIALILSTVSVTTTYDATESQASVRACANDPSTQPLLLHETTSQDSQSATLWELGEIHYRTWNNKPSMVRKVLKSVGWIFFLAAVAKATRPLFLTYIQHRVGITPELASYLWSVRTVMSLVIFVVFLPLVVVVLTKYTPWPLNAINLYTAKISVILLTTGALLIGLARSKPVLVSGVTTDLALLSFTADVVTDDLANCVFMTIASLESAGTLIGILLLYPLYQLGLHDKTLFGGIPYYLCAGLFTIAGIKVWRMKSLNV
ncbi:hypothetical protein FHL15_007910 [Xylaria flabelliformis]|uniref:Uncharacterized protein n=1 Tax=Xylaria flabelliformis TaxID=2512241 RepID=A0A553HT38_9PEZI|nr:hypothetical protein FHL15_007910 [Xylaria flabelliformis]